MRILILLVLLAGCPDRTIAKIDPQDQGAVIKKIPVSADIDILFVIDNSASTNDKQTVFASNFPRFVQALDAFPSGRPNVHIGVVSTTVGTQTDAGPGGNCPKTAPNDDGLLQNTPRVPGCTPPTGRFISDIKSSSGMRTINYTGGLDTTLSCIAQLGATGCGFEAPLEAMKRALDGSRPENAGFLRKGAYLAVIILTDEDDCSVRDPALFGLPNVGPGDFRCQPLYAYTCDQPISATTPGTYTSCKPRTGGYLEDPGTYASFLATVKDPSQIVVALIGGDPKTAIMTGPIDKPFVQTLALEPSCSATINGNLAIGRPAIRLSDFLGNFGDRGLFRTVCQSDYSNALTDIGNLLFQAISPCLEGNLDTRDKDAANPGLQPDCTVSDATIDGMESRIDACPMTDANTPAPGGPRPCWWVKSDAATCATETKLELHVERTQPPAPGTTINVECATAPPT